MNRIFFLLLMAIPQVLFGQNNTFPTNGHVGIGTTSPGGKLEINHAGGQLKLTGGTVAGGVWTSATDLLYLADWQTGLKGLSINMSNGNTGIGTNSPGARISFPNVDATNLPEGITWNNSSPLAYGIYRTAGIWAAPNYQQLKFSFDTGIILDPGSAYGKSYVDIQGAGLRVSSGNVGIGTTSPDQKLDVRGNLVLESGGSASLFTGTGASELNRYLWLLNSTNYQSASGLKAGGILVSDSYSYANPGKNDLIVKGNVGIGTTSPTQKLTVNGTIYGKEVKVDLSVPGPDYVFDKDYKLTSLEDIKTYIDQHKHLPEVPSAKEMEANGVNLGEMNMLLLKKIEELTLYVIEQQSKMEMMNEEYLRHNASLENEIDELKSKIK